jgi:hypothetical protein
VNSYLISGILKLRDNTEGSLSDPVETTRWRLRMTKAYLLGALHDGTVRKLTFRIVAKEREYIEFLAQGIKHLGQKAWIYKEGKTRNLHTVEFSRSFLKDFAVKTKSDKIDYIRGYFDTEGGISRNPKVRYYIYFAQKNLQDLEQLKQYLKGLGIVCGHTHNPSKAADSHYWRFFISCKSYERFAQLIGSWHPIKSHYLRMKI